MFIDDPTLDNLNNCLSEIENGFDVIKISKLLTCVLQTKAYAHIEAPYLSKANEFYSETLLEIRNSDNLIDTDLQGMFGKVIVSRDGGFNNNSYGSKLRVHPRNDENSTDFVYSMSVPDMKSLNHKISSVFERNMLRSGHSFGLGISGTTNLSCFFTRVWLKQMMGSLKAKLF